MLNPLANVPVEFPFKPENMIPLFLNAFWQAFLLIVSATPWWVWLLVLAVLLLKAYRRLERIAIPAEFRQPCRRRRYDW